MQKYTLEAKLFKNYTFFIKLLWEASPGRIIWCIGINLLHHLYMFMSQIIFIQFLLNSIQVKRPFSEVVLFILAMGAFAIIFRMIEDWYTDCYGEKTNHIIHTKINKKMFEKAAKMDKGERGTTSIGFFICPIMQKK